MQYLILLHFPERHSLQEGTPEPRIAALAERAAVERRRACGRS